ncbi:MAG: periplasmic heavy metal sensor [Novosphingobium sp.]
MRSFSRYVLVAIIAFCAALAAVWLTRTMAETRHPEGGELHALMHRELRLDANQQARVEQLEGQFAAQRRTLDEQLQDANGQLASAIANEHQYGPRVAAAVDHSHKAMGELQKATLSHVFAMRAVLRADQAARFDKEVGKALTRPGLR